MTEIQIKLNAFEGPLDLLLHLIKKLEIDIYDIPIADITDQYLAYLHTMKTLELDVAGEYLVMAATLMAIKSKLLLPKQEMPESDDEFSVEEAAGDPREALVEQLLNYRKFKYAAHILHEKENVRQQFFAKEPADLSLYQEKIPLPPLEINTIDLFMAFHDMLHKQADNKPLHTTISAEEMTVDKKMIVIRKSLSEKSHSHNGEGLAFHQLFTTFQKSEIVITFMALLELMKDGEVLAEQQDLYSDILLFAKPSESDTEE